MTTFNYAHVVGRAIESVLSQLGASSELLVIDDGSQDETEAVLRDIAVPHDIRAAFYRQRNAGPAAARNVALQYCAGSWVLFLDGDDMLQPGSLDTILDVLDKHPDVDLLLGGHVVHFPDGREKYRKPSKLPATARQRLIDYLIHKRVSVSHGCAVFRRSRLGARPYPEKLRQGEDIAVFAYMLSCPTCITVDAPLATIFKHPDSLRNDVGLAISTVGVITDAVFSRLPPEMREYRKTYEAQRALSAFRTCYKAGRFEEARMFYSMAFNLSPYQTAKRLYLWKRLRMSLVFRQVFRRARL
ncbi:glycosyltransferase family 2 protein [Pseudomonas saliphila]|uniref:glycosyltransferase family 2 protein n=1 Tax=Pseudomonas saliphila TaxID=2586906 RepID=UPI0019D553A3|nr:glycosyltransferase family A protein [Pseudomonas saliphila]